MSYKIGLMSVMLLLLVWAMYRIGAHASLDANNKFDFSEAFLNSTGKTSMANTSIFVALVFSSWALVVLVVTENLTEWFFGLYITGFVLNGVGSKMFDKPSEK